MGRNKVSSKYMTQLNVYRRIVMNDLTNKIAQGVYTEDIITCY